MYRLNLPKNPTGPSKTLFYGPRWSLDDCVKVVEEFYRAHGRPPLTEEIAVLSKRKLSPSLETFRRVGGFDWVLENAKLEPPEASKKSQRRYTPAKARRLLKSALLEYRREHEKFPNTREYGQLAKDKGLPSIPTLSRHLKASYPELCASLGGAVRRGKQANQIARPGDER